MGASHRFRTSRAVGAPVELIRGTAPKKAIVLERGRSALVVVGLVAAFAMAGCAEISPQEELTDLEGHAVGRAFTR